MSEIYQRLVKPGCFRKGLEPPQRDEPDGA